MSENKSPLSNLPGWDIAERMVRAGDFDAMLRAAFDLRPKYRGRNPGSDAEQLAMQVGELAGELETSPPSELRRVAV